MWGDNSPPPPPLDGFGALATDKGLLPLKALAVQTRIDGLLARTTVTQTFINSLSEPLEATYIFPLPDRAAVTRFRMEVAGRVIEGSLKERGEARRDYDQAIQSGRRAGIAEEERPGVFTLRVGNLMPGESATIRLTLTGPLTYEAGEATFRFPLVVAPRYIPGHALPGRSVGSGVEPDTDAVPDASRISPPVLLPGFPNPVRLSLSVELHPGDLPISDFCCSLPSEVVADQRGVCRIVVEPGERLDRDFILRFRIGTDVVRTSLQLQPDGQGSREGTFLLTLTPPTGQAQQPRPRDVVFVLDRSGSMAGWKIVAARRALARMVDTLTDRDRFTVYAFSSGFVAPSCFKGTGLFPATDRNRFRVMEFLAGMDSGGGTEMAGPLSEAVAQLTNSEPQRDRILVLVTDGQVGNEDQILRNLGDRLRHIRVFTLGIDQAVNEGFLKRLASMGGGACELVESEDRLDEVMDRIHRRIGTPLLTGLRVEPAGLELDRSTLVPGRVPDLFAGAPLFILGRYHGSDRGALLVRAEDSTGKSWTQTVTGTPCEDSAIASVWARGHVRELEDRYATGRGEPGVLMKQIVNTSLRFGVLCRFTAFVAVDVKEVVNPGGQVQRMTQPVESPAGWEMLGTDGQKHEQMDRFGQVLQAPVSQFELSGRCRKSLKQRTTGTLGDLAPASAPPAENAETGILGKIRREVEKNVQSGPDMVTMGKLAHTPGARKVIAYAIEEARNLQQDYVGPEHLLLGLLREQDGVAAQVLKSLGFTLEDVRKEVLRLQGQMVPVVPVGPDRFTHQALRVMQLANQEAQRFNHEYISTEHILLAIVREGTSIAAVILGNLESLIAGQVSPSKDQKDSQPTPAGERRDDFWK